MAENSSEARPTHTATQQLPLSVVVADLHNGEVKILPQNTFREAHQIYNQIQAQARTVRPFIYLDNLSWMMTIRFKGGATRVVTISNGEKVLARSGAVQDWNRRQAADPTARPEVGRRATTTPDIPELPFTPNADSSAPA